MQDQPLPPEVELATPGAILVVDDSGRLRDRSPRAQNDPELGAPSLGDRLDASLIDRADGRLLVHDGSALDALWFSRGEPSPSGGLSERDFGAMLHRLRNLVGILVASLDTEDMLGAGPTSSRIGSTRRREVDRMVDVMGSLGHAFAPTGATSFVDLELVLRRTIDSLRGSAKQRDVQLRLDGARDARRGRSGDEALLAAGLHALVTNAIDVSKAGAEVRVRAEASAAAVTRTVADDGPGLLPPTAGDVGTPFCTSKRGALGIGLVIARRAAFAHGGELRVSTRPQGAGVSARLWLPTALG